MEIDGGREDGSGDVVTEDVLGAEENGDPESMDNEDEKNLIRLITSRRAVEAWMMRKHHR